MPPRKRADTPTLASRWSKPQGLPIDGGDVGHPLICVASTYTFHADYFESELLARFLGLRFDSTEAERPFIIEREQALGITRAAVFVDSDQSSPRQSTLRWDQLSVRVPHGVQHSKIAVLVWERCVRIIVGSANLTRTGYRRNHELASTIDFFNDAASAPRDLALEILEFMETMTEWVRANDLVLERVKGMIGETRARLRGWRQMVTSFGERERPRTIFAPCAPAGNARRARSPLSQAIVEWGSRKANRITVMTPFGGIDEGSALSVAKRLAEVGRHREIEFRFVVPGHPSEGDSRSLVVELPRSVCDSVVEALEMPPEGLKVYVIRPDRDKVAAIRNLHAKAVMIANDETDMLLTGSSNFTARGMGVGTHNIEANLIFIDEANVKRDGVRLEDRLPVKWDTDLALNPYWPDSAEPPEDEKPSGNPLLPLAFVWATHNQRDGILTVGLDPAQPLPSQWVIRLPGAQSENVPPLADHTQFSTLPEQNRIAIKLPDALRAATLIFLRVDWMDRESGQSTALMLVQVESRDQLLPPEEFRSLSADTIIQCLLAGMDPAEWLDRQHHGKAQSSSGEGDSLKAIDTDGYLLYRTRRFGQALATIGEKIRRTVRTRDAIAYRLCQDPLGPLQLARTLVEEWETLGTSNDSLASRSALLFSLAETKLMLAYTSRYIHADRDAGEPDMIPQFVEVLTAIKLLEKGISGGEISDNFRDYVDEVAAQCKRLLGNLPSRGIHAD